MENKEYIEKLAKEALNEHNRTGKSLTECAINVSTLNSLSESNIENLCSRMNHIKFAQEYVSDPMAQYPIAKIADVKSAISPVKKVAGEVVVEIQPTVVISGTPMQKVASELDVIKEANALRKQCAYYKHAMDDNVDELQRLEMTREGLVMNIYKIIEGLLNEGSSLKDIHTTLVDTLPDTDPGVIKELVDSAVELLRSEGRIDPETEDLSENELNEEGFYEVSDQNPLVEPAQKLASTMGDIVVKTAAYFIMKNELTKIAQDYHYKPSNALPYIYAIRVQNNMEKVAAAKPLLKSITGNRYADVALTMTAFTAANKLLDKGIKAGRAIKHGAFDKPKTKKKLLKDYPDLQRIPEQEFDRIFESVVNLDPGLMVAPYALYNIINRIHTYGAMDTSLIMDLQGKGGPAKAEEMMKVPSPPMGPADFGPADLQA